MGTMRETEAWTITMVLPTPKGLSRDSSPSLILILTYFLNLLSVITLHPSLWLFPLSPIWSVLFHGKLSFCGLKNCFTFPRKPPPEAYRVEREQRGILEAGWENPVLWINKAIIWSRLGPYVSQWHRSSNVASFSFSVFVSLTWKQIGFIFEMKYVSGYWFLWALLYLRWLLEEICLSLLTRRTADTVSGEMEHALVLGPACGNRLAHLRMMFCGLRSWNSLWKARSAQEKRWGGSEGLRWPVGLRYSWDTCGQQTKDRRPSYFSPANHSAEEILRLQHVSGSTETWDIQRTPGQSPFSQPNSDTWRFRF